MIDWLGAEQLPELQAFFDEHWQRGHVLARDAELVRWQHRFPDHPDRVSMLVAREEGQIAGVLGMIPVAFCWRGRRVPGAWLAGWIATPHARSRQVGLRLLRHATDSLELSFIGVTGVNEKALRIYRALGFSICESIPRWVRVISEDALARLLRDRVSPLREPATAPASTPGLQTVTWSDPLAQRWDDVWRQRLAPRLVGTWRDAAYLRWRYLEHPRFSYSVRVAQDVDGSVRGMSVHRVAEVLGSRGRVVRVLELLGDEEAMTTLATDAVACGVKAGAAFADMYCTADAVAGPLASCGFTLSAGERDSLPALFEPIDFNETRLTGAFSVGRELDGSKLLHSGALYVTRSDSDQDRPNRLLASSLRR
jgi:GNAT superfamily N-acetyltransferase